MCGTCFRTCLDAVARGGNPLWRRCIAVSPVETTAVAHGGNPQDRTASPRPRCIALF
ncbi:hypothetical protein [Moorena sp. SIO3F7]|uniref:hypothetical protein n=1 Tax=Moorena sp. SIO3F7 TaxID=2607839 RepID=UPI001401AD38|nr:hypothetical protein [Moorena sp. SIO3F7]NEQ04015.1 hypothetical protein [Moorena sp. SIO3F7]